MKLLYKILTVTGIALFAACSPKTGEKAQSNTPAVTGKAPKLVIPQGDVRKKAPMAGEAPSIQIGKAETFQLDNGLKVIVVENHKLPQVSFRIFADYDPILEKDAAGYIDVMGELLSKGTARRTKAQIDQEVDFIGASLNTDANGVSASCLTKHTEKALDLMSDVLLNPVFPQEEFEKSIKRTESNLASQKDDAGAIMRNVGARVRYGKNHPYGEFTTETTLKKVTLEQVKKHYTTFLKPNISYLVITGDITKAKAEQYARKYFGAWVKAEVPKNAHLSARAPQKTVVDLVHKPGAVQSVINITYPIDFLPGTDEAIKARLMNTVLGGYFNSRVNANLREGHGWTYGANTNLRPDKLIGSFTASASVRNAVTDSAVIEFMKEMNLLRTQKVANSELQVVKNVLTGQFSRNLEEPGTVAEFALNSARYNLPADYYETYLSKLNNTSPEEILVLAKKYVRPDNAHIVVVGNRDDVADRLKQFDANGKVNMWTTEGEPAKIINTSLPPGTTGATVITDYINAIGGADKAAKIKDLQTTVVMKTRGMEIIVKQAQKGGDKLLQEMLMGGQSLGKTILSNGKAIQTGQGGVVRNIDGSELNDLKEQALPIKEVNYLGADYQLMLKGIEEINGKGAYLIEVTHPGGNKTTEYYDVATSLKVREISMSKAPDGSETTVTNDYEDYKAVDGVKFPHATTTTGVFPMPMKAVVSEIKANAGVDDAIFEIK
jgi:predicted Zn-dependent peptidase